MTDHTTKGKILETMYHLIAEKGYDKTSIGQIADIIGIKKASVYYYFKSKEDIFLQIVKELYKDSYSNQGARFKQGMGVDAYRRELILIGEKLIDSYFDNQDLRKVYAEIDIQTTRISALKELRRENERSFNQFLNQCLKHGIEVGALPNTFDIACNAQILYTVLIGIDQGILYDLPIDPKPIWREVVWLLLERHRVC